MKAPNVKRVAALVDHFESLGAYTQAAEVAALARHVQDIRDALGTAEEGDNLVEVARAAHRAEQRCAALETAMVGLIADIRDHWDGDKRGVDGTADDIEHRFDLTAAVAQHRE